MAVAKKTTKKVDKKVEDEVLITCVLCGFIGKSHYFYKHRNPLMSENFSLCKNCAAREANVGMENFHLVLRILNMPFLPEEFKEAEARDNVFGHYLLLLGNPKKRYNSGKLYNELVYNDSPIHEEVIDVDFYIYNNNEKLGELYSLFGSIWTKEELIAMNRELDKMVIQYGGSRDDLSIVDAYSEIIQTKWLSKKAYNSGNIADGERLSKLRQTLLKNNGLSLQDIKDSKLNESFGVEIDYAEDEPIIPDKKYFDIDGINFMFEKFLRHMERFIGGNKTPVDKDYEDMVDYVENNSYYEDIGWVESPENTEENYEEEFEDIDEDEFDDLEVDEIEDYDEEE